MASVHRSGPATAPAEWRALVFAVDPLGVRMDGTYTDGVGQDLNLDFLFESRGRLTQWGYEIEILIPLESLRYQKTEVQRWGIQVVRHVMHSGHERIWTPADRSASSFLGQSGTRQGLSGLRRGLVWYPDRVIR